MEKCVTYNTDLGKKMVAFIKFMLICEKGGGNPENLNLYFVE